MSHFFKSFTSRDLKMLSAGAGATAVFFIFWLIFATSSLVNPKMPKVDPLEPSLEMVQFFGKTNVLAQKFPLRIWHIDSRELMEKVNQAFADRKLNMGANNQELELGDYLMFNSNSGQFWGYAEDGAQIENTYTIVKE